MKNAKSSDEIVPIDDEIAKVEGTGSGFIWDKFGHIVGFHSFYVIFEMMIHHAQSNKNTSFIFNCSSMESHVFLCEYSIITVFLYL